MQLVDDYDVNRIHGRHLQSFAATERGQNGIPKVYKECLFAFQHILVIVDAKKYSA